MNTENYWNNIFSKGQTHYYSKIDLPSQGNPVLIEALRHFGDIKGKTILDIGCGNGSTSLFFASQGAIVTSIDTSEVAISNLIKYCHEHQILNITPIKLSANDILTLDKVDYIFGSMILHHIEPFNEFVPKMKSILNIGGKAFFYENNAQSRLLIWFRENIVGKLWVPKYGDEDEFPLKPSEVEILRKYFNVCVEYPELYLFRMISHYLLKSNFESIFLWLDRTIYKFKIFNKYSYRQYLYLSDNINK